MNLTRCDNCRTELPARSDQIIRTREPDPEVEPRKMTFDLFGSFIWHDFCSWSCVGEFATVRAMDPSLHCDQSPESPHSSGGVS